MGKGSGSKARVVEYRMSIHFGIGHKLDGITEIRLDEKTAWFGDVSSNTALDINQPNLYGGQQKEGGAVGTVQVLLGADDQVLPEAAASRYGRAPMDCPAFRGITTLMFHGSAVVSTGRPFEWLVNGGPTVTGGGFLWKMNSPVIAQKVEVTGYRAPKGLNPSVALSPDRDANFVAIIYECLTNTEWGMGGLPSLINKAGFETEAARLAAEGMFGSVWWLRQTDIETFIVEMLTHIQATLFLNPNSGLLDIKLLRDDYDVENLRHITPSNAALSNFKRRSSGEIVNEMTITWTNPVTEQGESITAQDIASIENQGGEKVSGSGNYYAIRKQELAIKVLQRDLRASTAPLISADAALDRSAWDLLPGEVVLMSWPKRQTYSTVMRIGKVNYGRPTDSKIRVSMLQDVFSLEKPRIAILPGSGWEDPRVPPEPLTMQLFTVPSYFTRNAELQTSQVALTESEALVGALADSETYDSFDYELVSESITAAGETIFTSKGAMSMTGLAYLSTPLTAGATSVLPWTLYPIPDEAPKEGGFVVLGYGDTNQEFALVTGRTDDGWVLARGCLDTTPKNWAAGTPVWAVNPGSKIVDTQTIHGEGTTATYRGLDRTALGVLPIDDAPPISLIVTDRPNMPIRPANVKVNGVGFGPVAIGSADTISLSWSTRNRLLEDTQVLNWTDGSITPEYRQETVIRFYDFSGALIIEYDGFWDETAYDFPTDYFNKYASVTVEVAARRDGVDSLTGHRITITGLPGDIGAPPPGPGVDPTDPPSYIPAPAVGAYEITGNSTFGGDAPAILVSGTPDNRSATQLLIRYRVAPGPDNGAWTITTPYFLNHNRQTHVADLGLLAQTNYEVEVSYIVGGVPSRWRNIGQVTTGGTTVESLAARLETVEGIASANAAAVADLEEIYGDTVSAAASAIAAGEAANLAVLKAGEATDAASASNVSAGIASTKADEAGTSASAANASKLAAQLAETNSGNSAAASVTAASQAQTYRDQSGEFASASSGSATAAATSAGNASTFASQASTSAGNANTAAISAGVSASSAAAAANNGGAVSPGQSPESFGVEQWTTLNATANLRQTLNDAPSQFSIVNGALRITNRSVIHIHAAKALAHVAGHRIRVSTTFRRAAEGGGAAENQVTLFTFGWDAAGNLNHAVEHTSTNPGGGGVQSLTREIDLGAEVVWIRTMVRVWSAVGSTDVLTIETADIQSETAAATSAAAALTQAASASASAASASISANLAASISGGALNVNSTFGNYPDGAVVGVPTGWAAWNYDGASWDVARVPGRFSPYAFQQHDNKTGTPVNCGIAQDYNQSPGMAGASAGYYVLEADCRLIAGHWHRSGVFVYSPDGDSALLSFAGERDTNGALSADAISGRPSRSWRKLIRLNSVPNGRLIFHLMTQWDGFGGGVQPKILIWDRCAIRPASDAEIAAGTVLPDVQAQLSVTASVAADVATRMATARFEVIAAAGSDPAQLLVRADSTGSLAAMVATSIRLSNVVGGVITEVMRLEGGRALFASPISIIQGGRRTTLGPGFGTTGDLHLWSGPSSVGFGSETIDNGILGISATDGFFGGRNPSGPFDSLVQAGEINLPINTWTTVAQVSDKYLYNQAYIVAALSYEIYVSGAAGGSDDYSYNLRLLMTNLDGSNPQEVPLPGLFQFGANNIWIDLRALNFREATITTSRGRKNFYFQINPTGANITVAKARNRRLKGAWTQPIT